MSLLERLGFWWCRNFHPHVTWPREGGYECVTCRRRFELPFDTHYFSSEHFLRQKALSG